MGHADVEYADAIAQISGMTGPPDPGAVAAASPSPVSRSALLSHLGLALTLVTGLAIVARVMGVAGYDVPTAQAILSTADGATLLLGTTVGLIPTYVGTVVLATWALARWRKRIPWSYPIQMLVFILALLAAYVTPLFTMFGVVAILVLLEGIRRLRRQRGKGFGGRLTVTDVEYLMIVLIIPVGIAILLGRQPWLPSERITLARGEVLGYFLGSEAGWTSLLQDNPRVVMTVHDEEVLARAYCRTEVSFLSASIASLGAGPLPPCK